MCSQPGSKAAGRVVRSDTSFTSLFSFKTYLAQYEPLLAVLGRFRVAFASPGEYRRPRAERLFQAFTESVR